MDFYVELTINEFPTIVLSKDTDDVIQRTKFRTKIVPHAAWIGTQSKGVWWLGYFKRQQDFETLYGYQHWTTEQLYGKTRYGLLMDMNFSHVILESTLVTCFQLVYFYKCQST